MASSIGRYFMRKNRGSKFGAVRVKDSAGRSFASKYEKVVFDYILTLEKMGVLKFRRQQAHVTLTDAGIIYKPDYEVEWLVEPYQNQIVYMEAKGFETPEWRIKRKLYQHYGPAPLMIFKGMNGDGTPKLHEEIVPGQK